MRKRTAVVSTIFVLVLAGLLGSALPRQQPQAAGLAAALDVPFFSQTALRNQTVSNDRSYQLGNSDLPL